MSSSLKFDRLLIVPLNRLEIPAFAGMTSHLSFPHQRESHRSRRCLEIPAFAGMTLFFLGALPVAGFAAGFFQQAHVVDDHAAINRFAHIVNGQQRDLHTGERLHFDPGLARGFSGDGNGAGVVNVIKATITDNTRACG